MISSRRESQSDSMCWWAMSFNRLFGLLIYLIPILGLLAVSSHGQPTNTDLLPPGMAARQVTLPDGFKVSLFAGEPDIVQPVAMNFDDRGRLWVVEMITYADMKSNFDLTVHDRIVILEDSEGSGHFDKRKVFW